MRKLLIAGAENTSLVDLVFETGIKNVSLSFLHLPINCENILSLFDHAHITPSSRSLYDKSFKDIEEYLIKYAEFLRTHLGEFTTCCELDVAYRVGKQKRLEYRSYLEAQGVPVIPIYNGFKDDLYSKENLDTIDEWETWVKNNDIVGISLPRDFNQELKLMPLLDIARKSKKQILLIGSNDPLLLRKFPFYMVESNYWIAGSRFGMTFKFNGTNLIIYDATQKSMRQGMKSLVEEESLNFDDFINDDYHVVNKWNLIQWKKYGEYLDTLGDYWDNIKELAFIERKELTNFTPKLYCDTCFVGQRCPKFKEHTSCAFNFTTKIQTPQELVDSLLAIISQQSNRIYRGLLFENLGGGGLDPQLTQEVKVYAELMRTVKELGTKKVSLHIEGEAPNGVLAQLLSGLENK